MQLHGKCPKCLKALESILSNQPKKKTDLIKVQVRLSWVCNAYSTGAELEAAAKKCCCGSAETTWTEWEYKDNIRRLNSGGSQS